MPWFPLTGDERITQRCASEDCTGQPTWRLEAGGVGSNCCSGCKSKILICRDPSCSITGEHVLTDECDQMRDEAEAEYREREMEQLARDWQL